MASYPCLTPRTTASLTLQRWILISFSAALLCGCGLTVPDIKEAWDTDRPADTSKGHPKISGTAQIEFAIKKRVYCDLKEAIQSVNGISVSTGLKNGKNRTVKGPIPPQWGVNVSLSLQVDESISLTPGVSFEDLVASFTFGAGGTLSSTATRIDKFNPYWPVSYLMVPNSPQSTCLEGNDLFEKLNWKPASSSPLILESDLGIKEWLQGAMLTNVLLHSIDGKSGDPKPDTVSYEIKFVVVSSGSLTPTWKLVRFSANSSGEFFGTGRTRTHDLIITIGPNDSKTLQDHLASQIGNAVSSSNRALLSRR